MSAPLSHHDPSSPPGAAFAEKSARERVALARKWAYLVSKTAYLPLSPTELEQHLLQLIDQLFEAVRSEPFEADLAAVVGDRLVELRCVGRDSLRRTMEILGKALLHQPELRGVGRLAERAVLVLGVMMSSYNETLRQVAQKRHENLYQALLKVTRDSQQEQLISEAQFDEVFAYSKSGLAITGLDGRFLRTNVALNKTLGYSATEIAELTLFDVIDPDQMATLRAAYQDLIDGKVERFGHEHQLVCKNGKTVWTFVAGSLVRDAGDKAQHVVTIIENDTDLSLLQKRLSYQSLHDALTGLPNRQFFSTRLESVLRHADPRTGITLYHLDLDSFSLIIGGLGYDMGERLLKSVANRLVAVVADEKAIVARLGPDDFGILVENTSTTPDVGTMVDRINQELSEPVYFDGQHGVAASVSIGVVHLPELTIEPTELLRAADTTLRRTKGSGRGQWRLFDPTQDARDRKTFSLAASMPGALENGQIRLIYQPLVRLADEQIVGIEALLRWDHPDLGPLSHDNCVKMAEETGLILPLGNWLLRSACKQVRQWQCQSGHELPLSVGLTPNQAADPDLVGQIRRTLEETGLSPRWLQLGFPVQSLLSDRGETVDNLKLLTDIGTESVIHNFDAVGDLACLSDLSACAVRVARRLVNLQTEPVDKNSLITHGLTNLVEIAHLAGAKVIVDGIETRQQASWWRQVGGDIALGGLFPPELVDLPEPELPPNSHM